MASSGRAHQVRLSTTAPAAPPPGALMLYDVIEEHIVARSGVLQCIVEAGGDVELPHTVTLPEFAAWRHACQADAAMRKAMPLKDICDTLRVADALDDSAVNEWVDLVATRITAPAPTQPTPTPPNQAQPPPKPPPTDPPPQPDQSPTVEQTAAALLERMRPKRNPLPPKISPAAGHALAALPGLLQQQIYRQAVKSIPGSLEGLLRITPDHLHPGILQIRVSSAKNSINVFERSSPQLLRALCALPASPPTFRAMTITGGKQMAGLPRPPQDDSVTDRGALFADALTHHSTLTGLTLGNCAPPTLSAVAPAAAALASLTAITLGSMFEPFHYESLPLLRPALSGLSDLQALHMTLGAAPAVGVREWALAAAHPPPTPICAAQLLSGATALTSLTVGQPEAFLTATQDFALPRLAHLELPGSWLVTATALLRHLDAPAVTTLSLGLQHEEVFLSREKAMPEAEELARGLAKLTALRTLALDLPEHDGWRRRRLWHDRVAAHLSPALSHLSTLEDAIINGDVHCVLPAVPAVAAAATALTRLSVTCRCVRQGYVRGVHGPPFSELWAGFLETLRLPGLQALSLEVARGEWAGPLPGVGGALTALTALTDLAVTGYRGCFAAEADVAALAALTRLQQLRLGRCEVAAGLQGALGSALKPLSALQEVILMECGLTEAFAAPFAAAVPALRELRGLYIVSARISTGVEAILRSLAKLRHFERFSLSGMEFEIAPEWDVPSDDEDMSDYESDLENESADGVSIASESERMRVVKCVYDQEFARVHKELAAELGVTYEASCLNRETRAQPVAAQADAAQPVAAHPAGGEPDGGPAEGAAE